MRIIFYFILGYTLFSIPITCHAYSVLTHEAIIDASWKKYIQPLLIRKYGMLDSNQLKDCRAYAYGGSIIPDLGYYPTSNKFFTDLTHYVRSGDFIEALFSEAKGPNDFAFAIGALSHYFADRYGHELGINPSVPIIYQKDKKKFGPWVTYEQDKIAHIRVEFSFDVLQTARGSYISEDYHDFIGFKVAISVLERAFAKTYCLDLKNVIPNLNRTVETFRWIVKNLIPEATKIAWSLKNADIKKQKPEINEKAFIYRMHRREFTRQFGKTFEKPGIFHQVSSVLIKIIPKIGPLKTLKIKIPNQKAERLFTNSFDMVLKHFQSILSYQQIDSVKVLNINFDTGRKTEQCEYALSNVAYAFLLNKLKENRFNHLSPSLKANILAFYSSFSQNKDRDDCSQLQDNLNQLKATLNF